ncbi:MAG: PSD1 and planctomycete cytochrome C domain-containing protein [Planctomycetia bacterium]
MTTNGMAPIGRTFRGSIARGAAVLAMGSAVAALPAAAAPVVDFNRDVRPILSNHCFQCHGPDAAQRQAGLRLDTPEGAALALPSGGRAVVAGDSHVSAMMARLTTKNADELMPPPETGKPLSAGQIETLRRWIDDGAKWRGHWAFEKPTRFDPPTATVSKDGAVRHPIDRFLDARIEADGLTPTPEADRTTLIRRATYDLTGLPPTPAEIDAFVADASPRAYEELIDRLLASPRFGEHLGRYWLDAARYGDSHGLHFDNERSLWPYRDWVIRAFNDGVPFNRFVVEQVAGDLLPNATREQKVASGFNRCNVTTSEGGSIDEEVRVRYAVDRVETTGSVFLGLTLGCAVCHDHKFDPVSQREFYQFFAFFNSSTDAAMDGNTAAPPPFVQLTTNDQDAEIKRLADRAVELKAQIEKTIAEMKYDDPVKEAPSAPREYVWIDDDLPEGAQAAVSGEPWRWVEAPSPVFKGKRASARDGAGTVQHFFTGAKTPLKVASGDVLFSYVYLDPAKPPKSVMLQFNNGSWEHRAYWGANAVEFGADNTPGRLHAGPLPEVGKWVRLEIAADKVGLKPGEQLNGWAFTQFDGQVYWDAAGVVSTLPRGEEIAKSLVLWEAAEKVAPTTAVPADVKTVLGLAADKRTDDQKNSLRRYYLENVFGGADSPLKPLKSELAVGENRRKQLDDTVPKSMVMGEAPQPRDAFILIRGAYDKKGDKVVPGTPAVLPPMPTDAPKNRLGLANWLVDPNHPLTARVTVNRFWQQLFGHGLVRTPEDFGAQGALPTHPELLDWLATEFVRTDWNVKEFYRMMATTAAYRRAALATPDAMARDPGNERLARGARFRLDAEMIRDGSLYAAGLLVEQIGGKSVKPYQPAGVWEAVGFQGSDTSIFKRDAGHGLFRRSLYTFWKRTAPPPSLATFDAPSRETCTVRRPRTNTPLQALVLMNDEQFIEAARWFAGRILAEGGSTDDDRLTFAFRWSTARRPTDAEKAVLKSVLDEQRKAFAADTPAAAKLVAVGETKPPADRDPVELGAWTMVANLLFNLDETITKE